VPESGNKQSKSILAALEAELLDAIAPVDPGKERTERMHTRLLDRVHDRGSDATADLVTVTRDSGDWVETSPGNKMKVLRTDDEVLSVLVRLAPGAVFPAHSHPADEETFVLEGETNFGDIHLVAGDYHLAPKGTMHGEVTTENGCLLLIRAGVAAE